MNNFRSSSGFMSSVPVVTKNLIIINVLFWAASAILPKIGINIISILGLHYIGSEQFMPSQLITYMFMHDPSSFGHVFFNMFGVYMFGRVLEQVWGPKRFLLFYMVTGIGAALIQEITWYIEIRPFLAAAEVMVQTKEMVLNSMLTIGASGSVFGILLGFGMLFPNAPLYLMFIPVPIKAKYMVVGYGVIELSAGIIGFSGDNIAHFAHLGGMLFGYFLIRYWKKKGIGNDFFLG
ncbi:MAG: rhomboid family intramembrane serine protease [Bacteroidales bacterium]|nr:rhomboid family intramembrane serine protease [Bacteroidales bacterium]